ncbi:MAG: hypothetical protein KatS3mg110_4474 [Pirellulaceae bacterium]|nr:MAG: hypothetical protein KatS3mg110_4474 [Pirellulaceae bacterium]
MMGWFSKSYHPGDWVVYRKVKRSTRPGPRARRITPARYGEEYLYEVKKFYVVEQVEPACVVVRTRKGRQHRISKTDPRLRHAHWWEKLWLRHRFPQPMGPSDLARQPQGRSENSRAAG